MLSQAAEIKAYSCAASIEKMVPEEMDGEHKQACFAEITNDEQIVLKNKQTENIIKKIRELVTKVEPIHEAYEENEDPDMS